MTVVEARTLNTIKAEFLEECETFKPRALEFFRDQGNRLMEIKERLPHGEFEGWCDMHLPVKARQRQKWMAIAKAYSSAHLPAVSINQALGYEDLEANSTARDLPPEKVQRRVKASGQRASRKVKQQKVDQEQRRRLKEEAELANQLLEEQQAETAAVKAMAGDVPMDDALAEKDAIIDNLKATNEKLRQDLATVRKRADDAEVEAAWWKAQADALQRARDEELGQA